MLEKYANKECRVLVVATPTNTNCVTLQKHAPSLSRSNFSCLSRLDFNRARSELAIKLSTDIQEIKQFIVWGNQGYSLQVDTSHMLHHQLTQAIQDDLSKSLSKRGHLILQKKSTGSLLSAVYALVQHLQDWFHGSQDWTNMAVISDGSYYGIPQGICIAMPVQCKSDFTFQVISNLTLSQKAQLFLQDQVLQQQQDMDSI